LQPWWNKTCEQKILGYEYRNSPFHFTAMNLNFSWEKMLLCERESAKACWKIKPVDPKFPGTGLSDIKKSFEKIAMTFLARTKIKGIYHQSYLCLY
jgi:hypothetical protein